MRSSYNIGVSGEFSRLQYLFFTLERASKKSNKCIYSKVQYITFLNIQCAVIYG